MYSDVFFEILGKEMKLRFEEEKTMFSMPIVMGLLCVHMFTYWSVAIGAAIYYNRTIPIRCYLVVLRNQLIYSVWPTLLVGLFYTPVPFTWVTPDVYGWVSHQGWKMVYRLPGAICVVDVVFHCVHRMLHSTRWIYVLFHSQHHSWKDPLGASALFSSGLEHCISNIFPVLIAAAVCGHDELTLFFWVALSSANTVLAHATKHGQHHKHHVDRTCNFGVGLLLCDRLCMTRTK